MKRTHGAGVKTRQKRRARNKPVTLQRYRAALEEEDTRASRRRRRASRARANRNGSQRANSGARESSGRDAPSARPAANTHVDAPDLNQDSGEEDEAFDASASARRERGVESAPSGVPETLPYASIPPAAPLRGNNFYIYPIEVIDYIYHKGFVDPSTDELIMDRVRHFFRVMAANGNFAEFYPPHMRNDPVGDPHHIGFVENEASKFLQGYNDGSMFAGLDGEDIKIPADDVRDLPVQMMLYILFRLQDPRFAEKGPVTLEFTADDSRYNIINDENDGMPIVFNGNGITMNKVYQIYTALMSAFARELPIDGSDSNFHVSWNGSIGSGTRIMLHDGSVGGYIKIHLQGRPTRSQSEGSEWNQSIEDLIMTSLQGSVISVRNRNDKKCLLYALLIGLMTKKVGNGGTKIFGMGKTMVEDFEVITKGNYMFSGMDDISKLIRNIASSLLPPSVVCTSLQKFAAEIDRRAGTSLSISEFRKAFQEIEEKLELEKYGIGVDVFGMDFNTNVHVYPLYVSKERKTVIDLLCITPKGSRVSHYCFITNMERLMRKSGGKQFWSCATCGECFYHRRLLMDHKCNGGGNRDVSALAGPGGYHFEEVGRDSRMDIPVGYCSKCRLAFSQEFAYAYHKEHCLMSGKTGYRHVKLVTYDADEHPHISGVVVDEEEEMKHLDERRVMYADFESSIDPESGEHTFMSYGVYDWLSDEYKCGYDIQELFDFILKKAYSDERRKNIYVYFHNAMGYDASFILRHVLKTKAYEKWKIKVIMKSMNRLQKLSFYVQKGEKKRVINIGDTFLFLTLSLENIVASIRKEDIRSNKENFPRYFEMFAKRYNWVEEEMINHILRKNIFPYKFFESSEKLDTPIEDFLQIFIPAEENLKFFSERVTLSDLEKTYEDTKKVMEVFRCKDARDYHDIYLCCDVMQLADVFDRSMNILWESHKIHLTKYIGMPSATWAAFLRNDPTLSIPQYECTFMAEFFKASIRGGITCASKRYAKADAKHSILYLDVNGLYPYVMREYKYPTGYFRFRSMGWRGEMVNVRLKETFAYLEREGKGMFFCVDMHFPDDVKRRTDMYPFAPEHRRIYKEYYADYDKKEFTPFLKRWSEATGGGKMSEFTGLVCTLYDKEKYNVHWRLLQFYMEHGVEITKVYFAVEFAEEKYLASYVAKNIEIRNRRTDMLGKTVYKLLGNALFGKTIESPLKRDQIEIVRDPIKLQGMIEEGNIVAVSPIDDLAWIVKMDGEDIILDKPTYIGASILEYAKLHMYTLLYDKLIPIFPGGEDEEIGCQLVYTDTDSFIVRVRHPDGIEINSPQDLFAYIRSKDPNLIGGIGGQIKSETGEDATIKEIIALRAKVYAYITTDGEYEGKAKGTGLDAQAMQLNWEKYKEALESCRPIYTRNAQIHRETFKLRSEEVERLSLSVNDGKRYIWPNGIDTSAFGNTTVIPH